MIWLATVLHTLARWLSRLSPPLGDRVHRLARDLDDRPSITLEFLMRDQTPTLPEFGIDDARDVIAAELQALRDQGIAAVLDAVADGRVDADEATGHIADIADTVIDALGEAADALLALPEPFETQTDVGIAAIVDGAKARVVPVVARVVEAVRNITTRDVVRLEARATRAEDRGNTKRAARLRDRAGDMRERARRLEVARRAHAEALRRAQGLAAVAVGT